MSPWTIIYPRSYGARAGALWFAFAIAGPAVDGDGLSATFTSTRSVTPFHVSAVLSTPCQTRAKRKPTSDAGLVSVNDDDGLVIQNDGSSRMPAASKAVRTSA